MYEAILAVTILMSIGFGLVIMNSFCILKPDEGVEVYLIGTHRRTYLPSDFRSNLADPDPEKKDQRTIDQIKYDNLNIKSGLILGLDIVFALWPIWKMYKFSTSGTKIQIHAGDIFTKGTDAHPRVELHADPVLTLRFLTVREVIRGIGLFSMASLEEMCDIGAKESHIYYRDTRLALHLREQIQELFLEALRQSAASFVWSSNNPDKEDSDERALEREIGSSKKLWEALLMHTLASSESLIAQGKILNRPSTMPDPPKLNQEKWWEWLEGLKITDFFGSTILSADINITGLDLAAQVEGASAAQNAINTQFVKQQEARGAISIGSAAADVTKLQGTADASRITAIGNAQREVAEKMLALKGVDANTVLLGQMVGEKVNKVNINGFGDGLTQTIAKAFGGKKDDGNTTD